MNTQSFEITQDEKGAILPLVIIILLIVGILVVTKLVSIPQIFKSRASNEIVEVLNNDGTTLTEKEGNIPVVNSENIKVELEVPEL